MYAVSPTHDQFRIHLVSEVGEGFTVKLAYYYGNKVFLKDSLTIRPAGKLSYTDSFHEGIYLLVFPDSDTYEFMVNDQKEYFIKISYENNVYKCSIRGDSISNAFDRYNKSMSEILKSVDSLKKQMENPENTEFQNNTNRYLKHCMDSIDAINDYYAIQYKGTFLGNYVQSQLPVSIPELSNKQNTSDYDSLNWFEKLHYYKDHFLDNTNWNDQRLIYTPVYEEKLNTYFEKIVACEPESLSDAIDIILCKINNQEVFRYITESLFRRFAIKKYKPFDEYAYLHLIRNYYLTGKTPWLNDNQLSILENEYNRLLTTSLGQSAPKIVLPDQSGKLQGLYDISADYTIVLFWNYECKNCRRILHELASITSKYSYFDIHVFTVFTGKDPDIWKAYLATSIPDKWVNTCQFGAKEKATIAYNISAIPSIFLLNSDKSILNKNLTVSELDSYLFQVAEKM